MRYDVSRQAKQLSPASWTGLARQPRQFELPGPLSTCLHILGTIISNQPANHASHAVLVGTKGLRIDGVGRGLLGTHAYRYMASMATKAV